MAWGEKGVTVCRSKESATSIIFAKTGQTTIRQNEVLETTEYRGLTEDAAKAKVAFSDETSKTTYYASINGETYSFEAIGGTKTDWHAERVDETGQWVATENVHTYTTTPESIGSPWGTNKLDAAGEDMTLTSSGRTRTLSSDKSMSYVFSYSGNVLLSTNAVTVKEIRYVNSQTNANALVSSNTSSSVTYPKIRCTAGAGSYTTQLPVGTEKRASASYVDAVRGWTVTVTETTYGWTNANGNTSNWAKVS